MENTKKLVEDLLAFLNSSSEEEESQEQDRKETQTIIEDELNKILDDFPIWGTEELGPNEKVPASISRNTNHVTPNSSASGDSVPESDCRRNNDAYVQEVNRAIYGDTTGHPPYGSEEYFKAAENYALYGKDFLDFPENMAALFAKKCVVDCPSESTEAPMMAEPEIAADSVGSTNIGNQLVPYGGPSSSAAAAATYYPMCNTVQTRHVPGNTPYGMFVGNQFRYMAATPTAPQPLIYNRRSSTSTFICNASSPPRHYTSPVLATTSNTFFRETQFLPGGSRQLTTTGVYEHLVYAQMVQPRFYHQAQQQHVAGFASMYQHYRPPRPASRSAAGGGAQVNANVPNYPAAAAATAIPGVLNLGARQPAMPAAGTSAEMVARPQSAPPSTVRLPTNTADDINPFSGPFGN